MKRRLLSLLLCLAMVAECLPTAALAAAPQKAIELNVTQLEGGQRSSIYFGNYQQSDASGNTKEPVKWRVLANNENANGSLFLLADQNLDVQPSHTEHADVTWENSYLRAWLNSTFMKAAFSNGEQQAIKATYVYNKTQSDGVTNPNPDYSIAGGNNTTDRIFLPSIEEMNNSSYFPAGNGSRVSTNTAYVANKEGMHGKVGKADYWWLRSPGWKVKTAAYIQMIGAVWTKGGDINASHFAIRPAFNIDLNTVLFASAAVGGKGKAGMDGELTAIDAAAGSNEWKLTLLDSNRHFDVAEKTAIAKPGGTVTLSYTGASSGTNEYISAIIADGSGAQYYGRIMRATDEAGTVAINIPEALADGEYTLQVFSEQYNGGENDDTKRTDYASAFASVALTVTGDTTAPTLSHVSTSRTDMAKASVRFNSDEAGSYYYAVVESGADEPTIDTSGVGISCDAAEHDILLENLADAGAKDIYIVAKDAAGNVSNKLKITIPAYHIYTLHVTAPPFETVYDSDPQPDAKPITIQSVGNTDATIERVSVSGDAFTIGGGGDTVEAGKAIDTWTIQPKAGLSAGTHTATITVTYNNGLTATAEISITVEATYRLTVALDGGDGKDGSGSYVAGTQVALDAGSRPHYRFVGWTTSDGGTFADASASATTFIMPSKDVTVKANWTYCGSGGSSGTHSYTIKATAGENGMISPFDTVKVRKGSHQTFTITPHNGYTVSDVMVDGQSIGAVTTYTFENVKKSHTIEAFFEKAADHSQGDRFEDVVSGSYYEEAVKWAVQNGITSGTDATHFSPDAICTRAQAVVFLWRISGSPKATDATMPFSDVPADSYYYDAVLWGVENGLVKGTGATQFSPQMHCSRAQIVTFLWRAMDTPQAGSHNPFTDVKDDAYYYDAVLWAVKDGVTKGTTDTTFSPKADCTRAQIVVFLWRMFA